ncbi:MAG: hypothetical protein V1861_00305, partial [Candidatus Micrarchaeota archaeon]
MRLRHADERKSVSGINRDSFIRKAYNSLVLKFITTAAASAIAVAPIAEGIARAQEVPQASAQDGGTMETATIQIFSGIVSQNTVAISLVYGERALDSQVYPSTTAELQVSNIDDLGVEFKLNIASTTSRPDQNASFRVNYDGTRSGDVSVFAPLG